MVEFQETESRRLKLAGYSRKCVNERANSGGFAGVRVLSALVRTVIETWDYRVPLLEKDSTTIDFQLIQTIENESVSKLFEQLK